MTMSEINVSGAHDAQQAKESAGAAAGSLKKMEAEASRLFNGLDTVVPEAVRTIADRAVTQSREAYENAREAMEETVEVLEKSIDKAGQGTAALNRKAIDIAQTNLNTGFDLAKGLAGARNLAEIMELQSTYARKQFETLAAQAEEFRALSVEVAKDTADPVREHVTKSIDKVAAR